MSNKFLNFNLKNYIRKERKQLRVVKDHTALLNTDVPVIARIIVTKDEVKLDNLAVGNTPVLNHDTVEYVSIRQNVEFVVKDEHGNETKRNEAVGPGTNYRLTKDFVKLAVSEADKTALDSIKAEGVLVKFNSYGVATDAKLMVNGFVGSVQVSEFESDGYIKFPVNSWSNSDERNGGILHYNSKSIDPEGAFNRMDDLFGGAISAKLASTKFQMAVKDLEKKIGSRNGMLNAPMLKCAELGPAHEFGILVVKENLKGQNDYTDADKTEMEKLGIEIDSFIWDGMGILSAELVQEIIRNTYGIKLTTEEAAMISGQYRSNTLMMKIYGATEVKKVFTPIVSNIKAKYKTETIGNPDKIGIIVDANSYKLMTSAHLKAATTILLYVLDIARATKTKVSMQMIQKFIAIDEEATIAVLNELADYSVNNYINESRTVKELVLDESGKIVGSILDGLHSVDKDRATTDKYALEKLIGGTVKFQRAMAEKIKTEVDAYYLRALFDYSGLIQNEEHSILRVDRYKIECYNVDILVAFHDEIEEIFAKYEENLKVMTKKEARKIRKEALDEILTSVAIKYPCPGNEEYQVIRFLTLQEIAERIEAEIKDTDSQEAVYAYFFTKGSGCILLAPVNTIKFKLAGMDTDYDALACVFEKGLVDIVVKAEEEKYNKGEGGISVYVDAAATVPQYKAQTKAAEILNKSNFVSVK